MALNMAYNQRPQYLDNNGNPLSMGRVTFLDVGTEIKKDVFADPEGVTTLSNPILLDVGGFVPESSIFYGEGNYSVLVEYVVNPGEAIPVYAEEYLVPVVVGSGALAVTGNVVNLDSVEDLANLDMGANRFARCSQYYDRETFDQGGGLFKWYSTSTAQTDLGMIFSWVGSPTVGRFFRIGDGESIKSAWYGVASYTGASMNNRLLQADAYCVNELIPILEITEAEIGVQGTITLSAPVKINAGVRFTQFDNNFAAKLVFTSDYIDVVGKTQPLVTDITASLSVVFLNKNMDVYPAWLGAFGDGISDDYTPFYNLRESVGHIVIDKGFNLTAVGSPSSNLLLNKLKLVSGGYIINDIDSLTVFACSGEEDAHNVFRGTSGDFANYTLFFVGYAKWFFDLTCSDIQLSTLRTALIRKHLIWDRWTTYTLSPLVDCQEAFKNEVKFGTLLKSDSKINFGQIVAGSYQVFALDTLVPGYVGPKVDGAWFGADRFASFATNTTGVENAILASNGGVVDFGGVKLQVGSTVYIPDSSDVYKIKNLNLLSNVSGVALSITGVEFTIMDSTIDGMTVQGTADAKLINSEIIVHEASQNVDFVTTTLKIEGCTFKSSAGDWTGELTISGTDKIVFDNNIVEGGELEYYCSGVAKSNSLSDNTFITKRIGTDTAEQDYLTVRGGDKLTCNGNVFSAINNPSSIGIFNQLKFKGYNGTDVVDGLVCTGNSFNSEMNNTPPIRATFFADTGHNALVHSNVASIIQGIPRATRHLNRGSTANADAVEETEDAWIFPNMSASSFPYFAGTSWATGDSGAGTANVFAGEILTYTPSSGEASITYKYRVDNYAVLNYVTMDINVEQML